MNQINLLSETEESVTISRNDWEALLDQLEDTQDRAAVRDRRAREATLGVAVARRDYLTGEEMMRLLNGEAPVKLWRGKRGMTQRALAQAAGVNVNYLCEIEGGKKPGSAEALRKLAGVLDLPMETLVRENGGE